MSVRDIRVVTNPLSGIVPELDKNDSVYNEFTNSNLNGTYSNSAYYSSPKMDRFYGVEDISTSIFATSKGYKCVHPNNFITDIRIKRNLSFSGIVDKFMDNNKVKNDHQGIYVIQKITFMKDLVDLATYDGDEGYHPALPDKMKKDMNRFYNASNNIDLSIPDIEILKESYNNNRGNSVIRIITYIPESSLVDNDNKYTLTHIPSLGLSFYKGGYDSSAINPVSNAYTKFLNNDRVGDVNISLSVIEPNNQDDYYLFIGNKEIVIKSKQDDCMDKLPRLEGYIKLSDGSKIDLNYSLHDAERVLGISRNRETAKSYSNIETFIQNKANNLELQKLEVEKSKLEHKEKELIILNRDIDAKIRNIEEDNKIALMEVINKLKSLEIATEQLEHDKIKLKKEKENIHLEASKFRKEFELKMKKLDVDDRKNLVDNKSLDIKLEELRNDMERMNTDKILRVMENFLKGKQLVLNNDELSIKYKQLEVDMMGMQTELERYKTSQIESKNKIKESNNKVSMSKLKKDEARYAHKNTIINHQNAKDSRKDNKDTLKDNRKTRRLKSKLVDMDYNTAVITDKFKRDQMEHQAIQNKLDMDFKRDQNEFIIKKQQLDMANDAKLHKHKTKLEKRKMKHEKEKMILDRRTSDLNNTMTIGKIFDNSINSVRKFI